MGPRGPRPSCLHRGDMLGEPLLGPRNSCICLGQTPLPWPPATDMGYIYCFLTLLPSPAYAVPKSPEAPGAASFLTFFQEPRRVGVGVGSFPSPSQAGGIKSWVLGHGWEDKGPGGRSSVSLPPHSWRVCQALEVERRCAVLSLEELTQQQGHRQAGRQTAATPCMGSSGAVGTESGKKLTNHPGG